MNNKIIAAIVGLVLMASPVLATGCDGPSCIPNDGSIDTYFSGSGWNTYFDDVLYLNDFGNADVIIENVWTDKGSVTVLQNVDIEDPSRWDWFGQTEVLLNKVVTVDPSYYKTANVEKQVVWDGGGAEVFRQATLGDVTQVLNAAADAGNFIDDIEYKGTVNVYEAVGLNMPAICEEPTIDTPEIPECTFCIDQLE